MPDENNPPPEETLSSAELPQTETTEPADPSPAPKPVDVHGTELVPGDQVAVKATFLEQLEGGLRFIINAGTELEQVFTLFGHGVTKTASTRIGAAPQLRTPVIEIPHPLGGVIPVPANSAQADEYRATGKLSTQTEGLPNSNPVAAALEGDPKPLQDQPPAIPA